MTIINPIIIGALIVQAVVSKSSRVAGALFGFAITAGILVWGLGVYADGGQIQFFGIPLSQGAFLALCVAWFGFDASSLRQARATEARDESQTAEVVATADVREAELPLNAEHR